MQSTPWIALLKKLPPEQHNQLMVVTTARIEMAVQNILIIDGECLVFKGRLSGTQDAGRLFYVPYDRIDCIGFYRFVGEEEFRAWYGDTPEVAEEDAPAEAPAKPSNGSGVRSALPNRAALLERIRSRSTTADGTQR
jgi:hypothetical protein